MNPHTASFIRLLNHPLKFRMFMFSKLPSAYFAGIRIKQADQNRCMVTVPYKWFSKNPFHSTYFACLSMAAEMSTGSLAMAHLYKISPPVSMLVVKIESEYFKKATGLTTFVCEDGATMQNSIEESIVTGDAKTVRAKSVGKNGNDEIIAEFYITWSFKVKDRK